MKKNLVYVIAQIDKALAFEWIVDSLNPDKYNLSFVLIGKRNTKLAQFLRERKQNVLELSASSTASLPKLWIRLFFHFVLHRPDVVHTHLFLANITALPVAWLLRISKRIYTRHHAMIHYREYPSGLTWDKLCNTWVTHIVASSRNVQTILTEFDKAERHKVHLIPHGFKLSYFSAVTPGAIDKMKKKYRLPDRAHPVIGVIARYVALKGIQFIIPAFKKIQRQYPNAHLILANTSGDYAHEVRLLLRDLPEGTFTEIPFEGDLAALYQVFTVYVHTPIDAHSESFGQTYVEALAAGIPSVFTMSGVASEFIRHEENALVVDYQDSDAIAEAIGRLLRDQHVRMRIIEQGKIAVRQFGLEKMVQQLEKLYDS